MHLDPVQLNALKYVRKFLTVAIIVVLLACPPLVNLFVLQSHAAGTPSPAKITINNSQAGATGVTYELRYTATASTGIQRLTIQFCTTASGTCTTPTGMTTTGATRTVSNVSGTSPADTFGVNGTLRTDWTAATQSPLGVIYTVSGITNPSTINTTFYARVTSYSDAGVTAIDNVNLAIAVLDTGSIAVSATVDPNFSFTVTRAVTGNVNGDTINVSSTSNNSIPFGTLNTTVASVAAHDITITTNANNGYQVTASTSATPPLVSGANSISDFSGTNASPTNWSAPAGSSPNVNTGYFGYTTNSTTLCTGSATRFTSGGPNYAGFTTTGQEVACSSTPVNNVTTRVGWKLQINTIQPAGAYTGTIILVATPTY